MTWITLSLSLFLSHAPFADDGSATATPNDAPLLRFGVIADCQYCAEEGGHRRYRLSAKKLRDTVVDFNQRELDFVLHLGDFIDRDWESFDVVCPIFDALQAEGIHVLGNHDYSVADERKPEVPARLGMPARFHSFRRAGFRFLVLDGNDISLHASGEGSIERRRAEVYHKTLAPNAPTWNGAIGLEQLTWVDRELAEADTVGERAFLLCHFPIHPPDVHNLWNDEQVLRLIDRHPSVVAWLNGHNHAGNYAERDGVHFLTFHGMVDTETTAYAVATLFEDRLLIEGLGRQPNHELSLRAPPDEWP